MKTTFVTFLWPSFAMPVAYEYVHRWSSILIPHAFLPRCFDSTELLKQYIEIRDCFRQILWRIVVSILITCAVLKNTRKHIFYFIRRNLANIYCIWLYNISYIFMLYLFSVFLQIYAIIDFSFIHAVYTVL